MADDDYDLLPHSELRKLEQEIDSLKQNPNSAPNTMQKGLEELNNNLRSMMTIFNEAKNELRIEDEEKELVSKKIDPITAKLDDLLDQNEKIAEGILTVADMIKKIETRLNRMEDRPSFMKPELVEPRMEPRPRPEPRQESSPMQQSSDPFADDPFASPGAGPLGSGAGPNPSGLSSPGMGAPSMGSLGMRSPSGPSQGFGAGPSPGMNSFGADSSDAMSGSGMPPPPPPKPPQKKGFFGR